MVTPVRRSKAPHPRSLQDVVGISLPNGAVGFVVLNLEHDLERGIYLTLKLATESEIPVVRAMYSATTRFFARVDDLMTRGDDLSLQRARDMLQFPEPEEYRLGYVVDGSDGNGLGDGTLGDIVFTVLQTCPWLRSLLRREPDAVGAIPLVGLDRIADIIGTICKVQLLEYTRQQAQFYRFKPACMQTRVIPGCWIESEGRLGDVTSVVPVDDLGRPFILVPGEICRSAAPFNAAQFFREMGLDPNVPDGRSLKERMMQDALEHPERFTQFVLDRMKDSRRFRPRREYRRRKDRR